MGTMNNPLNAYKQTSVKTAGQGKLIVMLYDEALKQIRQALELMDEKTRALDKVHNALVKTQDIVTELMAGLDFEKGGEIAQNLFSIYMFVNNLLKESNLKKDPEPLRQVKPLMEELRSAWAQIAPTGDTGQTVSGGVNIAG